MRVFGARAQFSGIDTVKRRRLVQRDEGVRIVPMPARLGMAVDECDVRIGLGQQGVGERHAGRARADDEVVGGNFVHGALAVAADSGWNSTALSVVLSVVLLSARELKQI